MVFDFVALLLVHFSPDRSEVPEVGMLALGALLQISVPVQLSYLAHFDARPQVEPVCILRHQKFKYVFAK